MSGVSVVLTVLNEAEGIRELLRDLLAQELAPDEIVVVDGGSIDRTADIVRQFESRGVRLVVQPGANISRGRNAGIAAARNDILAVTDAGVRLGPDWLGRITEPLRAGRADVAAGFFRADPRSRFETALGATTLPDVSEIDPASFLPSSRSIAFCRSAWQQVGGYPEWLDYCEDLIFDLRLRANPSIRFSFVPRAVAYFRPRSSLRAFFRQYYRYARGDGKADLWRRRHVIRYATYSSLLRALIWLGCSFRGGGRWGRWMRRCTWLALALGGIVYARRPAERLARLAPRANLADRLYMLALVPLVRLSGDIAKMAGYPIGVLWRLRNHPPDWRT